MHPGEDFPHAVEPRRVLVHLQAGALGVGPLDQPRVAELVGVLAGIVPDAETGVVLRHADGPRLPRDDVPECGASLLCERDIKRRHGRHGNVGHGLIHDALKGQEVVVPVAVHVSQRVHRAVVHDEAVAVPYLGPDAGSLEVQERKRRAAVERHRKRHDVLSRDRLRGHVLVEHCVTVRRPHEPPCRVRPFAVLIRLLTRAVSHGLVDPVLMNDGIPDLIGCVRVPRRGVVFRYGAGQQPDGLRLYELHARTPGIPSASHASTMSDVRRENLAISDMEMSMSRRSW